MWMTDRWTDNINPWAEIALQSGHKSGTLWIFLVFYFAKNSLILPHGLCEYFKRAQMYYLIVIGIDVRVESRYQVRFDLSLPRPVTAGFLPMWLYMQYITSLWLVSMCVLRADIRLGLIFPWRAQWRQAFCQCDYICSILPHCDWYRCGCWEQISG